MIEAEKIDYRMKSQLGSAGHALKARPRPVLLALSAMFLGGVVGLLLAEFAVRIFAPQALVSDVIAGDPDVDYRLRPNASGHMSSPEYSADIRINSLGFRGPEISPAKKPGVVRVLFLGDSFTFGHGLRENETLPFAVGERLEREYPGKFEVVNGGVYGYSTADELNLFAKYGVALKPDIVVTLFMMNDFADNPTAYKLGNDGSLIKQKVSSDFNNSRRITRFIPGADWLRAHSHLFKFVGVRVLPVLTSGHVQNSTDDAGPRQAFDEMSPEFYNQKGGSFEITTAILAQLAKIAKENGARPVLLTLGGAYELENGKIKSAAMLPHERLRRAAAEAGFSRALALPPLLAEYRGKEPLFFPVDTHWTGAATAFVAPAVAEAIARTAADSNSKGRLAGRP
jgi:lysophospholipase L1-like esterase